MTTSKHTEDARFLELLQKWRSGDFTRSDEQELFGLAGDDVFRQEALEGFLDFPENDHNATILALGDKIRPKRDRRRFALPQLLSIAAVLVLVFGAIWFFKVRPVPKDLETLADVPVSTNNNPIPTPPIASTPPNAPPRLDRVAAPEDDMKPESKDMAFSKPKASVPVLADTIAPSQNFDVAATAESEGFRQSEPGAVAQQSTNVPSPREIAKDAASRSKKQVDAAKPAPAEAKADKAKSTSTASSAQPIGGWNEFRLYLSVNARLTPEALANNVSGTVRLQFRLDIDANPVDFKIIRGLGYGCDEAAIQLVKKASWLRGNGQPVVVDVPFVR